MKLVGVNKYREGYGSPSILLAQLCCALFLLLLMGGEALAGYQADLMVRLASEGDASYLGESVFEATAVVQSRSQAAYSGAPAQFRLLLKNAGDQPDSFVVTGPGSGSGFTVSYLDQGGVDRAAQLSGAGYHTAELAPGASVALLVQVTPILFTLGASYRVTVSAVSSHDPLALDQVKTETVACGLTAAVTLSTPPDGSAAPGGVVNYPYTVTNVGNALNVFTLSLPDAGWLGVLYADDGAGGGIAGDGVRQTGENSSCVSTGALSPGASYRFFVAVTIPGAASDGARGDVRIAATGNGASGSDQVTTSAIAASLSLTESVRNLTRGGVFAPDASAVPGDLLQYRMSITNSGSAPATSVSIDSPLPSGLALVPDSVLVALAPEGDAAACVAAQCGSARALAGSVVAHLGQGASDAAGGTLLPGRTVYLFFQARVL